MTILLNKMDYLLAAKPTGECKQCLVAGERNTRAGRLDA